MIALYVIAEAITSIGRQWRRVAPMAAGIVWGVASAFVLAAIGNGFERTQRQVIEAFGDKFLLLRLNKPIASRGDPNALRTIFVEHDVVDRIRASAPHVAKISPKAIQWDARAFRGSQQTRLSVIGVDPVYAEICNVPLEPGGRWLDAQDEAQELPVIVLGWQARRELFGDEPCLGETIKIAIEDFGRPATPPKKTAQKSTTSKRHVQAADDPMIEGPYTREYVVIGAIEDVELSSDTYVSNRGVGFVTYPAYQRICPRGAGFLVMTPTAPDRRSDAIREVREVLSDRYGLPIEDASTVLPYFDAIARGTEVDSIFKGLQWFLGAVALLILLLGAAGVANVVMISVTARTSEFGLRRALGCRRELVFAQVFLEAGLVCGVSGVAGFLVGLAGVQVVSLLPLPEGFAQPVADLGAATLPCLLLLGVTLLAAGWPALRAIRQSPIDALHGGL